MYHEVYVAGHAAYVPREENQSGVAAQVEW